MLDENTLIETLKTPHRVMIPDGVLGIGDDAAVIPFNDQESYVISKDLLIEDRHFRSCTHDPANVAHKALHVNLSDCAAMGAAPHFVLLGLAIPQTYSLEWMEVFSRAFLESCAQAGVVLIGGDTTGAPHALAISVTIIGRASKTHLKYRHGARDGDALCVAGDLGLAHAGLIALERHYDGLEALKTYARRPQARVREGIWLGACSEVTAMLDVSDGLVVDVPRLATASLCEAVVDMDSLLPTHPLTEGADALGLDPLACMVSGGEDYALLCTIEGQAYTRVADSFRAEFGYDLMRIGVIDKPSKNCHSVHWVRDGCDGMPPGEPFVHFGHKAGSNINV